MSHGNPLLEKHVTRLHRMAFIVGIVGIVGTLGAQQPYGDAAPGPGGVLPRLTSNQAWLGNGGFMLTLDNAVGGTNAYVAISRRPDALFFSVPVNVSWHPVDLLLLQPLTVSGPIGIPGVGVATVPIPIILPPDPSLAGGHFFAQAYIEDPLNPTLFSATRGLR